MTVLVFVSLCIFFLFFFFPSSSSSYFFFFLLLLLLLSLLLLLLLFLFFFFFFFFFFLVLLCCRFLSLLYFYRLSHPSAMIEFSNELLLSESLLHLTSDGQVLFPFRTEPRLSECCDCSLQCYRPFSKNKLPVKNFGNVQLISKMLCTFVSECCVKFHQIRLC